jgi:hypothetical protein
MKSAASFGACVGVAFVVSLAACSRLDGPATSPSALRPTSSIEVRVERGGGSGGGGVIVGDAEVEGTFTFESGGETISGTYSGSVSISTPENVTLSVPVFIRKSDQAVFAIPVTSLDSGLTSVTVVLGVSPNPEIRIVDFRIELDQTFTVIADSNCPTGERHSFVLSGQIPQFGTSTLTLTHCEAVF